MALPDPQTLLLDENVKKQLESSSNGRNGSGEWKPRVAHANGRSGSNSSAASSATPPSAERNGGVAHLEVHSPNGGVTGGAGASGSLQR